MVKEWLEQTDREVTGKIINDLIEEHQYERERYIRLYKRYKAEDKPIMHKKEPMSVKANNKIPNDYEGEIVDQLIGLLFGNPLSYQIDSQEELEKGQEESEEVRRKKQLLSDFEIENDIADLDQETGKLSSICSTAARLVYIDKNGKERLMLLPPWEVIFVYDEDNNELQYAMRYWKVTDNGQEKWKVEWYDDKTIKTYLQNGNDCIKISEESHLFDYIPVIEFPNNEERLSDFEKVIPKIDAYDETISSAQDEIEELRQAYLAFEGATVDEEIMEEAKRTGAFGLPEGSKAYYLLKNINDTFLENQKKTLKENIYRFSKTVDYSDEKFSGSSESGESRKWKLLSLENRAIIKERKFTKSLRQQFKVLCSSWNKKQYNIDYKDIYWTFKRNLPVELKHEAEILSMLKGLVSDATAYSKVSFIDDVEWEIKQKALEGHVDLDRYSEEEAEVE